MYNLKANKRTNSNPKTLISKSDFKNRSTPHLLLASLILIFAAIGTYLILSSHAATTLNADFNSDGSVNITDLSILATNWGSTTATLAKGDANNDNKVTITDLSILAGEWGQTGGQPVDNSNTIDGVVGMYLGSNNNVAYWKPTLSKLKAYGINNVRVFLRWDSIQLTDGVCDPTKSDSVCNWSTADSVMTEVQNQGLLMDMVFYGSPYWSHPSIENIHYAPDDPTSIQRFTKALMTRYKGKIRKLQIWNEPNSTGFFAARYGSGETLAKSYTDVLKQAYTGAKDGDPNVIIVGGNSDGRYSTGTGATPTFYAQDDFLTACYAQGAKGYFDEWATHNYSGPPHTRIPEFVHGAWANNRSAWSVVESIRSILDANGDQTKKIDITEIGFSSSGSAATYSDLPTFDSEARYDVRHIVHAFEHGISTYQIMYIFDVTDAPLGVFNSDLTPRPALTRTGNLLSKLSGYKFDSRVNVSDANDYVYKFTNTTGKTVYVAWTTIGELTTESNNRATGNANITLPIAGSYQVNNMDLVNLGSIVAGQNLTLTNDPVLVIQN